MPSASTSVDPHLHPSLQMGRERVTVYSNLDEEAFLSHDCHQLLPLLETKWKGICFYFWLSATIRRAIINTLRNMSLDSGTFIFHRIESLEWRRMHASIGLGCFLLLQMLPDCFFKKGMYTHFTLSPISPPAWRVIFASIVSSCHLSYISLFVN